MNIAENSRQALEKRNDGQIRFRTRRTNEGVQVDIEDNGPGIPIEERERVFEPYRSGHHGGLGLGMALAKGIVLAHGGSIVAAESELGGARLSILLPLDGISTPEESA